MRLLKDFWKKWRKLAVKTGSFQALIIFKLFYFLILWTVGLFISFFSDPLKIKKPKLKTNFTAWEHPKEGLEEAQKPY